MDFRDFGMVEFIKHNMALSILISIFVIFLIVNFTRYDTRTACYLSLLEAVGLVAVWLWVWLMVH